jgi:pyruvate,water dikinase
MKKQKLILRFEEIGIKDVPLVGGKNASIGEMIRELGPRGIKVPSGFVITAAAYRYFLSETKLDRLIKTSLSGLDSRNLKDLARRGKFIRDSIKHANLPPKLQTAIKAAYKDLEKRYGRNADVAVRSSATAEDLPGASFAGEHETYLGIRGVAELLPAIRACMASLFTDRAISYRVDKGFDHLKIALSVGVEKMVRSDKGASGVLFTLDTESGFRDVVLINGSWGLGEMIVQGEVTPDEFLVWKRGLDNPVWKPIINKKLGVKEKKMIYSPHPERIKQTKITPTSSREKNSFVLKDGEVLTLARWGKIIEEHYSKKNGKWTPMDVEWAKDGVTKELFIVQARPETVHARRDYSKIKEYKLLDKKEAILRGASVGSGITIGRARVILDAKRIGEFKKGEILVTDMTDPDWEPIMKVASAIITDKGGRTSHAAIVSREIGISAVVGTERATKRIKTGDWLTVDTTGDEGLIYSGRLRFKVTENDIRKIPKPKTKVMVNIAIPESAFETSFLPNDGVGLAREEFIIASKIGVHPQALVEYESVKNQASKVKNRKQKAELTKITEGIDKLTLGWKNKTKFYVDNLAFGIAEIGAAFYPKPVIVRFSDFKTNEYRTLLGGELYEPREENPMIGWRGASRYYDEKFKAAFKMECKAVKKVRDEIGLNNVIPMVPFCRTVEEGINTLKIMAESGLVTRYIAGSRGFKDGEITTIIPQLRYNISSRGKADGKSKKKSIGVVPVYVMCEIPSNVILAEEFLKVFDGMSIGSNDLTQLVLGLDRDSGIVSHVGNEKNPAVKKLISEVIKICKARRKYIGICGQAPSDYPDFAEFLVEAGIDSMSLNPDTVVKTTVAIAKKEAERGSAKK